MNTRCISPSAEVLETRIAPAAVLALGFGNTIYAFDSDTPGTVTATTVVDIPIVENLIGIDFRPATGALYGISITASGGGSVYLIDPANGHATFVAGLAADPADATNPFTALTGSGFGMDFNPVPDRLRLVSDAGQNLRINVDNGLVTTDGDLNGASPIVTGSAYTNSFAGATGTTLYGLDISNDQLVTQNPPNNGTIVPVGPLGVNAGGSDGGFDILSTRNAAGAVTNTGFLSINNNSVTGFYTVDLATGAATLKGTVGDGSFSIVGLTAVIGAPAPRALTIDGTGHLLSFSTATPNVTTDIGAISGIPVAESIAGFDFRPLNGSLYVLTKDAGGAGRLYTVNTSTAVATPLGTLSSSLIGDGFGVDFNPVTDQLRILSDAGQNLRVNADSLAVVVDPFLHGAASGATAAAYSKNAAGAPSTNVYTIDPISDRFYVVSPTNVGTMSAVGNLGLDISEATGFDIRGNGEGYATLTAGGVSSLYRISIATGAATLVGAVGNGSIGSKGLALVPSGTIDISPAIAVAEGAGQVIVPISRVGGSEGTLTVVIRTEAWEAASGSDYTDKTQVVTFGPGVTSQNVVISVLEDTFFEPAETFRVYASPTYGGGTIDGRFSTVTISDNEPAPVLSISGGAQLEGSDGTTQFTFFVSLNTATQHGVSFSYVIQAGTADGSDVEQIGEPQIGLIFGGFDFGTVTVPVVADGKGEPHETFTVKITDASAGVTIGTAEATGTILNDDPISVGAKKVTYLDRDGDIVTVAISGTGSLDLSNFKFEPSGALGGLQLKELDLTAAEFARANVTISAKRGPLGGDSFVNIGALNAAGTSLGGVKINGDLATIDAQAVKSLSVQSMGRLGGETRGFGGPLISTISDDLGKLSVRTDIDGAIIRVGDDLGPVTVGGNLLGGTGDYSGSIEAGDRIASVTINGNIRGTSEATSASIIARSIGTVKVRGDIDQGRIVVSGNASPATTKASLALGSLSVMGSVFDADILVGFDRDFAAVNGDVSTGSITVNGDWVASDLAVGIAATFDLNAGTTFDGNDPLFDSNTDSIPARIAALVVRGQIMGSSNSFLDFHVIQAEQFGSIKVGATKFPTLAPGTSVQFGMFGDMLLQTVTL